jgi:uncharacterized membrane protein YfcA
MSFDILIVVIITSFIQSIFGVGVLLFGTPLLLLLGYDFIQAVIILLPISLSINLIQITKDYRSVDLDFYKKILLYTIPFVVIFLFVVTELKVNIGIIIGLFLLFVATKNYSRKINGIIKFLVGYEKVYFMLMGIIHGMTNLGGSLLTAIVHSKEYEKQMTRVTVAVSYATFAVFQIITLAVLGYRIENIIFDNGAYLIVGITVFIITEKIVYMEINNEYYSKSFATFLLLSGLLLCIKSI